MNDDPNAGLTRDGLKQMVDELISLDGPGEFTKDFNESAIRTFRANGGVLPGELERMDSLLLTTRGAKTGLPRTVPLAYFVIDERLLIVASMGGADHNPPWYHNVLADPNVTIELGDETFPATARLTTGDDRDQLYAAICERSRTFIRYQDRTSRTIPVFELIR